MIIKRDIFGEIDKYIDSKQAIVVTGMRRTGKTTVLQYYFDKIDSQNKIFLDLENPINRSYFEETNYDKIKLTFETLGVNFQTKAYVFLDEVQFVKNLPSVVKYLYDHNNVKFFLSGSASFYLKNLFSESLAGRKFIFELFPLNFGEFLLFKNSPLVLPKKKSPVNESIYNTILPFYEEFVSNGGFPEVVLAKSSAEKIKALEDIFSSYFQKEVVQISDFRDNTLVRKFILLLAERAGQKLDIQKVASEISVSRPTVYNFLDFLRGTYFIHLVSPFGKKDVSLRKQSKVYFSDTGLLGYLGKKELGNLFENAIFLKLKRRGNLNYFERKSKEIDFVQDNIAYEVKTFASQYDLKFLEKVSVRQKFADHFLFSWKYTKTKDTLYGFVEL